MATRKLAPTLAELNAQITSLKAEAEVLRKREAADVVAKARIAIAHYGLTAADLGFGKGVKDAPASQGSVANTPAKVKRKSTAASSTPRTIKFRDAQGNTWGGMGKRPAWFKAALAAGVMPEELLAKG